jgi:glycosidase
MMRAERGTNPRHGPAEGSTVTSVRPRPVLNVALALALLAGLLAAVSAPAAADHTAGPSAVTLVGSLQSELGCSGDWQPDCGATALTSDEGDGVWQATFTLPAGDHEYKVALNGGWDENYGANATPNGANITLSLEEDTEVAFAYDHGTHWVADSHTSTIATVPGDFQSALGCAGDWQPDCLRSWLQDPDGDGTYRFETSALPAGTYQGKVAIDQSWALNYGQDGQVDGPNVSFTVPADGTPMLFSWDSATKVLSVQPLVAPLTPEEAAALATPRVEHPVEDEVLYFTIPDRFENGDPTNDCGDHEGTCRTDAPQEEVLEHGYLPSDKGYYHGGDLAGLRDRLDYLADMGVSSIWVGPVFENQAVQEDVTNLYGHSSAYHGYWILDFLSVDPHLGTNEEFKALVDEAHAMGIKVFMDVITNHTADVITYAEDQYSYRSKADFPYVDVDGNTFDDSDYAYAGQDDHTFPEMDVDGFPYTPVTPDAPTKNPEWLNDPLLYHNRGNSGFVGENSLYGDFFGLDGLFTEKQEVVDGMVDIYRYWIEEFGVDGFRIDTTKHVNMEFWHVFGPAMEESAASVGSDHFFAFGEVFDQQYGQQFLSEFSTRGQLQSTIDFAFQMAARDFASRGNDPEVLQDLFAADDWYTDADSNAYAMPTFVGNHDMGRIGHFLLQDNPDASDQELVARSRLAHALMFFARGQPVIYYGDEQGFTGDGGDKDAREDMFGSDVDVYNDNDLLGTDATTADDNFRPNHPLYQSLRRYAKLYQQHEALRRGAQLHRHSSDGPGVYAFSRIGREERVEYVVALNNAETPQRVSVPTSSPSTRFHLLNTGFDGKKPTPTTRSGADGALTVDVPALGVVIYRANAPVPVADGDPTVAIEGLTHGQEVELGVQEMDGHQVVDRLEIGATVTGAEPAEVTFAVRETGGDDWTVVGTDTNAPYRVFYDTTVHEEGTPLDVVAVVDDLAGGIAASQPLTGITTVAREPEVEVVDAVVHYQREDGAYDGWGLHAWGDVAEDIDWSDPKPFVGEDDYGRFAWVEVPLDASDVGFIVHRGDEKDVDPDRSFDPSTHPEIWLRSGDPTVYTSQAAAEGAVTVHYRGDEDATLTVSGAGLAASEPAGTPQAPDGSDDYGPYWTVAVDDVSAVVDLAVTATSGDVSGQLVPEDQAAAWLAPGDETVHAQRGAADGVVTIHYRRPAGDYGDPTSTDDADFWGLHTWGGAEDPGWTTPREPTGTDPFGIVFDVPLFDGAERLDYILHRGDTKDPGPDQSIVLSRDGYEIWQVQDADPGRPWVLPVRR